MHSLHLYHCFLFSISDGDNGQIDSDLPHPAGSDVAIGKGDNPVFSKLMKIVSDQHEMLCKLKNDQERSLLALQDQMAELKASVIEEQKAGLSEIRVDQRILT